MKTKILSLLACLAIIMTMTVPISADTAAAHQAADTLHALGLFNGVGTNPDGTPDYDLERAPTRAEAVTLLVSIIGKAEEARANILPTPFWDVPEWAKAPVGYAYTYGLTNGTFYSTFSSNNTVTAPQFLTLVLRALGYADGTDFTWNTSWELTDKLGITEGQYTAETQFTRGDAAIVVANSLDQAVKGQNYTLLDAIQNNLFVFTPVDREISLAPKEVKVELRNQYFAYFTMTKIRNYYITEAFDAFEANDFPTCFANFDKAFDCCKDLIPKMQRLYETFGNYSDLVEYKAHAKSLCDAFSTLPQVDAGAPFEDKYNYLQCYSFIDESHSEDYEALYNMFQLFADETLDT